MDHIVNLRFHRRSSQIKGVLQLLLFRVAAYYHRYCQELCQVSCAEHSLIWLDIYLQKDYRCLVNTTSGDDMEAAPYSSAPSVNTFIVSFIICELLNVSLLNRCTYFAKRSYFYHSVSCCFIGF